MTTDQIILVALWGFAIACAVAPHITGIYMMLAHITALSFAVHLLLS